MLQTLTKHARHLNSACGRPGLPSLIVMTDPARLADPVGAVAMLPRGSCIILRHYGEPGRADLARTLQRACRERHVSLLIGQDAGLARCVGADGVHLPEHMVPRQGRWRRPNPAWFVTAAAHSESAVMRAQRAGVDAAILSPVFPTKSHPGAACLGPVRFAALAHAAALPVYALGGVNGASAQRLNGSGAAGIAAIGALAQRP